MTELLLRGFAPSREIKNAAVRCAHRQPTRRAEWRNYLPRLRV